MKLVVAYDGTDFHGWARQKRLRTVQSTLTDAVRQVSGEECEIIGASRTDAGAHAAGQVCHFDTLVDLPPERWAYALNRALPQDLSVMDSREVSQCFSSRFSATDRTYRYRILCVARDPLRLRYAHYYPSELDLGRMAEAATSLLGKHDFRRYSEELPKEANAVRELFAVEVKRVREMLTIEIVGTAFLRGMIRRISGSLLEVGRGYREPAEMAMLLDPEGGRELRLPVVLPACGLTLTRIRYGRHPRDHREMKILESNEASRGAWEQTNE